MFRLRTEQMLRVRFGTSGPVDSRGRGAEELALRYVSYEHRTAERRRLDLMAREPVQADSIRCRTLRRCIMSTRHMLREGFGIESRRVELLAEVARHQAIRSAREVETVDKRPFAAPGSFLVFIKRHIASGRFRPTGPVTTAPGPFSQ